jgi:hypothetical protein
MGDQHRLAEARGDRRGGVADMDHERAAADRGAVDLFGDNARCVPPVSPEPPTLAPKGNLDPPGRSDHRQLRIRRPGRPPPR